MRCLRALWLAAWREVMNARYNVAFTWRKAADDLLRSI
jgi:hypothetical protein